MFHDDQHGTAIVVLAALLNALRVVDKGLAEVRVVLSGAGAAGSAVLRLLLAAGAQARRGLRHRRGRAPRPRELDPNSALDRGEHQPARPDRAPCARRCVGADVFIGVSAPGILNGDDIATMAPRSVVFALANPDPEVDPAQARRHAAVVATGRSDEPNQINNVLAFPGVFRGLLDAGATTIDLAMEEAAARALAGVLDPERAQPVVHHPQRFDASVVTAVAEAVTLAAEAAVRA